MVNSQVRSRSNLSFLYLLRFWLTKLRHGLHITSEGFVETHEIDDSDCPEARAHGDSPIASTVLPSPHSFDVDGINIASVTVADDDDAPSFYNYAK